MKVFSTVLLSLLFLFAKATTPPDEGMWLPILLGNNQAEMQAHGCKLTAEQIYSINNSSMKDAIVWFGGGCTGEVMSKEGLVFTNHHCGYGSINELRFTKGKEHDLLEDGFWAKSKDEEIPAPSLQVQFVREMRDITAEVQEKLKGVSEAERSAKLSKIYEEIEKEATKGTTYRGLVREFFSGNAYYLFLLERYTDIRLVGTPPWSIGKFGGETDNWMWPRHTGDFSVWRIYAGKDNKPAKYSKDNVPYQPKHFLPVSTKGYKPGDFTMIMGFPGTTKRYEFSRGIQFRTDIWDPNAVAQRKIRLDEWKVAMNESKENNQRLNASWASLANYWKNWDGERRDLLKNNTYQTKKNQEMDFEKWAVGRPEYENIIRDMNALYDTYLPIAVQIPLTLSEGLLAPKINALANSYIMLDSLLAKNDTSLNTVLKKLKAGDSATYSNYVMSADQRIFARMLDYYYQHCPKEQRLIFVDNILKKYKGATPLESFTKYAAYVYANSFFASREKMDGFLSNPSLKKLRKDPAYVFASAVYGNYVAKYKPTVDAFNARYATLNRTYVKGLMEMQKNKAFYPDANSTLRLTYGAIEDYDPKDAVKYTYYTTLDGAMEKYVRGDEEFDLPQSLIDLYNKKDYGPYALPDGKMPVAFLTNNDITGGNSGSPVLNANGELIGLAFDGNWEAMSGNYNFDAKLKRTICVDVRYVLLCIDKLGGAENIIKELTIK
jgi:hypothetical protein